MKIDLNLDEFKKSIISKNSKGKSITTDDEYSSIRNYFIKKYVFKKSVLDNFKGRLILKRIKLEKEIEETLTKDVSDEIKKKTRIFVLINKNIANIFIVYIGNYIDKKNKLIFDFKVYL